MSEARSMSSSSSKRQPEAVADKVLRRAELGKMARRLQNYLALAQFKTKHGLEDFNLDNLEPQFEEQRRMRQQLSDGDILSDSSSSASDLPYPSGGLMSSPLKAGPLFSDAIGSSNGSTGHRKRSYMTSFDHAASSPSKRYRSSPTAHRSFGGHGHGYNGSSNGSWRDHHHQLAQSSPIKPRRQQHFTTSTGPDVSLFKGSHRMTIADSFSSPNYAALSDDEDDLLPAHSFVRPDVLRSSSPPRTPPRRNRSLNRKTKAGCGGSGRDAADGRNNAGAAAPEEGADLLLYLAASPGPANPTSKRATFGTAATTAPTTAADDPTPSTPPPKSGTLALPSSMMVTPGGGNPFPYTPGQTFDLSDFVNITPSPAPAQKPWKTPVALGGGRTPLSVARRRLTFDEFLA